MKHTDTALYFLILQFFCFTLHKYSSCHCSFSLKRISSIIYLYHWYLTSFHSIHLFCFLSFFQVNVGCVPKKVPFSLHSYYNKSFYMYTSQSSSSQSQLFLLFFSGDVECSSSCRISARSW